MPLYHPFPMIYCTFHNKSNILTFGSLSLVLIFSLLLSNNLSELVFDLSIILYYYYNILQYIYSFVYLLNYMLQFFSGVNSHLILCILCAICYKPKWNKSLTIIIIIFWYLHHFFLCFDKPPFSLLPHSFGCINFFYLYFLPASSFCLLAD